jgi:hypothetical protein
LIRPFGGLAEIVDQLADTAEPALLERYQLPLANLLPSRRGDPALAGAPELRSGLADFAFHGDPRGLLEFYWRRDVGPWMTAELIHFVLDAADAVDRRGGGPTVVWLEGLEHADRRSLDAVRLLGGFAGGRPLVVCAVSGSPSPATGWPPPWEPIESAGLSAGRPLIALRRLTAAERRTAGAAAVFALPFTFEAHRTLVQAAEGEATADPETLERLLGREVLRRLPGGRLAFALPASRPRGPRAGRESDNCR